MDKKDGGQAYPHGDPTNGGDIGMTLRDYFAAKALAGWWSSSDSMCALPKDKTLPEFQTEACARFYEWADAMLAARSAS